MKTLEHWILRVADSDMTWFGLNWLRPSKHDRIGLVYILFSSFLLGLPGIAFGGGVISLVSGQAGPDVWLSLFVLVMVVEVSLHMMFAHFWNRRAAGLVQGDRALQEKVKGN